MTEAPRNFWTYLKGPWHSFELNLSAEGVELKEYWDPGKNPNVSHASLDAFLAGSLNQEINDNMNAGVLSEALANAKLLKK